MNLRTEYMILAISRVGRQKYTSFVVGTILSKLIMVNLSKHFY